MEQPKRNDKYDEVRQSDRIGMVRNMTAHILMQLTGAPHKYFAQAQEIAVRHINMARDELRGLIADEHEINDQEDKKYE